MSKELEMLTALTAKVDTLSGDVKQKAESALAEATKSGQLSAETKVAVDKALTELNILRQEKNELETRLGEAEKVYASIPDVGKKTIVSMGERFTKSDGFGDFASRAKGGAKLSHSVEINAAITSIDTSAGSLVDPQRIGLINPVETRLFVRDLLAWGNTESDSLEFVRETGFTNNADVVAENPNDPKPESDLNFEPDSEPVVTIAHFIRASRQVLADAKMLQSYINARLTYGLKLKEEAQLLNGSGVGLNINGLMTQAQAYNNPGVTVSNETSLDRLRIAMLQVELADYAAEGLVLNPIDWAGIELLKDTTNAYLFANPFSLTTKNLWSLPVVATKSMAQNDFLTGAFRQGAQGWDRENITIVVSTEDRDNLVKNMVTILCEERVGLTVFRPEAFVKGQLKASSGG